MSYGIGKIRTLLQYYQHKYNMFYINKYYVREYCTFNILCYFVEYSNK